MLNLTLLRLITSTLLLAPIPVAAQFVSDTFDVRTRQTFVNRKPEIGELWYSRAGTNASMSGLGFVEQRGSGIVTFGAKPAAPGDDAVMVAAVMFSSSSHTDCARVAEDCSDNYVTLIGRADFSFVAGYAARVTASGSVTLYRFDGSRRFLLGSGQASTDLSDRPHLVAFSLKGSAQEVYVDNVRIATSSNTVIKADSQRYTGFSLSSLRAGDVWLYDFQASEPPSVTSLSPGTGGPGQTVTLSGSNLSGVSIRIGGKVVKPSSTLKTAVTFVTPTNFEGPAEVAAFIPIIGGDPDHSSTPPPLWTPPLTAVSPVKYSYVSSKGDPEEGPPTYFPLLRGAGRRSALQLHNPADEAVSGQIVLHPDGGPFTGGDPGFAFTLAPRETRYWQDLRPFADPFHFAIAELRVASGAAVAASMRLVPTSVPTRGSDGVVPSAALSTGAPAFDPASPQFAGETSVLLAPPSGGLDLAISTPGEARLRFDVRDASGRLLHSARHDYPNAALAVASTGEILGRPLTGGESIAVTVEDGAAFVSAVSREAAAGEIEIQPAARIEGARLTRKILPVAVSLSAPAGYYRTAALLHNPGAAPMELTLSFGQALSGLDSRPDAWCLNVGCAALRGYGSSEAPARLVLQPYETRSIPDLVGFLGAIGIGSVEIAASGAPVTLFRTFRTAGEAGGSAGALVPAVSVPLPVASPAVLLAPSEPGSTMSIGIRSLDSGATVELTLRAADGAVKRRIERTVAAGALLHRSTEELFGVAPAPNDSVSASLRAGAAIVYAAAVAPSTGDTAYQFVVPSLHGN